MNIEEERYFVSLGMRRIGGSFVKALGEALSHADLFNLKKIKDTWPEYWKEFLETGQEIDKNDRD